MYSKYPFLKGVIENEKVSSIKVISCDELPSPEKWYSHSGTDWCFFHTHYFEDSENLYCVLDENFEVEEDDIKKAYRKTEEHIKGISEVLRTGYWGLDIEWLIDEEGNHHNPDFFLDDEKVKRHEQFCKDIKVKHKFKYDASMGIYHPSSDLIKIANEQVHLCERIPDEDGKREISLKGYCDIHTSAEWHIITYLLFNHDLVLDRGDNWPSSSTKPHLITKSLMQLEDTVCFELSRGTNITHIIRHDYRKDKDFKEYSHNQDVYQFEPDGIIIFGGGSKWK